MTSQIKPRNICSLVVAEDQPVSKQNCDIKNDSEWSLVEAPV